MKASLYDGGKVRKLREQHGMSKIELAQAAGVTLMTIYRVEGGRHCSPDLLRRIAQIFDTDWRFLLREPGEPNLGGVSNSA
jgi:transcriptional regulator with XRE-family HTH domain